MLAKADRGAARVDGKAGHAGARFRSLLAALQRLGSARSSRVSPETRSYAPALAHQAPKPRSLGCLGGLFRPRPRPGFKGRHNALAMAPRTPFAQRALSAGFMLPPASRHYSDNEEAHCTMPASSVA
ncbi:hypothetical protein WJX81_003545 [Elliptochloris bilobata]|uniref:Uncharacterized protein n=1 Tax=Elliptochloris bilobata TaxID=381761 RepID=A0AAW1SIK0_9CHLO